MKPIPVGLRFTYSTRKCFQAEMPLTFRMKNVLGSSRGAVGDLSRRRPTSSGRRSALRLFTSRLARTQFSHDVLPPRERGRMWSILPSFGFSSLPVYWQRLLSRAHRARALNFGRRLGTLAKRLRTITDG